MKQKHLLPHSHWRHYKSIGWTDHTYEVIGIAKHSETGEEMVAYRSLYETNTPNPLWQGGTKEWTLFVRPFSMWYDMVEWNGKTVQRFTEM